MTFRSTDNRADDSHVYKRRASDRGESEPAQARLASGSTVLPFDRRSSDRQGGVSHIGKYKIQQELGRGATGIVYQGVDGFRGDPVAIKQTHAHLMQDAENAQRLRKQLHQEATMLGALQHPNIVRLLDADIAAPLPYLVLEYVHGEALSAYTSPDKLLPIPQVLDIAFKCCNALEHASRQGLIHRDIKPANLLLTQEGEVKLTDFGTAIASWGEATQVAGLVGSPCYMSPEQVREETLTYHSDMFSLAVVMYELLTGRRPFLGDSDFSTLYKISQETPPLPSLIRPSLPTQADALLLRALNKNPADRYPTWTDLAEALFAAARQAPEERSIETQTQRFARLKALDFFADFHDVALWELLRLGKWRRVKAGTVFMRENTPGDSFCIIVKGKVSVSRGDWTLSTLGPGDTVGEMTYLHPGQRIRTATAIAVSDDVLVLKIRNPALKMASEDLQSRFDKVFIRMLVQRLGQANTQLEQFGHSKTWDVVELPDDAPNIP